MQLTLIANTCDVVCQSFHLPNNSRIRSLHNNDLSELAKIYFTAYPREIVKDLSASEDEMQRTFEGEYGKLANELSPVLVIKEKIVGTILTVWEAPWQDTPNGLFIIEVFTHPAYRRMGIAKSGLIWVATEAQKKGFGTLSLRVDSENRSAITLYRSLGFHDWKNVH